MVAQGWAVDDHAGRWRQRRDARTRPIYGRPPSQYQPGHYVLNVEAARETGGRELITLPLSVPNPNAKGSGKTELGAVTISAR